MADPDHKVKENVPGAFYVDENCIGTCFCCDEAPDNIKMSDEGYAYFYKQPETPVEKQQCKAALTGCPVNAIGDDG